MATKKLEDHREISEEGNEDNALCLQLGLSALALFCCYCISFAGERFFLCVSVIKVVSVVVSWLESMRAYGSF